MGLRQETCGMDYANLSRYEYLFYAVAYRNAVHPIFWGMMMGSVTVPVQLF